MKTLNPTHHVQPARPTGGSAHQNRHPMILKDRIKHALFVLCASFCIGVIGFLYFVFSIPEQPSSFPEPIDGIVVLTGDSMRISSALHLFRQGGAKRLLVSGVHQRTDHQTISKHMPEFTNLFECCVDLGQTARNTVGNAHETWRWARKNGFKRLIIVTSNYHMPRSLAEFNHVMPDMEFIPYPVLSKNFKNGNWWMSSSATRTMIVEYLKFLVSAVQRITFIHMDMLRSDIQERIDRESIAMKSFEQKAGTEHALA